MKAADSELGCFLNLLFIPTLLSSGMYRSFCESLTLDYNQIVERSLREHFSSRYFDEDCSMYASEDDSVQDTSSESFIEEEQGGFRQKYHDLMASRWSG